MEGFWSSPKLVGNEHCGGAYLPELLGKIKSLPIDIPTFGSYLILSPFLHSCSFVTHDSSAISPFSVCQARRIKSPCGRHLQCCMPRPRR
jgi:hypothetical protein